MNCDMKGRFEYWRIANDISRKIESGEFAKGDMIPKQVELSAEYGSSRVTVQKALKILIEKGYLAPKKGVGTFVQDINECKVDKDTQSFGYLGLSEKVQNIHDLQTRVISFFIRSPESEECEKLAISQRDKVFDFIRVRYLDRQPFRIEYWVLPVSLLPELTIKDIEKSLFQYIEDTTQLKIGNIVKQIRADISDRYDRKYLHCQPIEPILAVEQVGILKNGIPFGLSEIRYRYDKGTVIAAAKFDSKKLESERG